MTARARETHRESTQRAIYINPRNSFSNCNSNVARIFPQVFRYNRYRHILKSELKADGPYASGGKSQDHCPCIAIVNPLHSQHTDAILWISPVGQVSDGLPLHRFWATQNGRCARNEFRNGVGNTPIVRQCIHSHIVHHTTDCKLSCILVIFSL